MIINYKDNVSYITFEKLKNVKHFFSTKKGGVSKGITKGMNLGFARDVRFDVIENFNIMADIINVSLDKIIMSNQIHSNNIMVVNEADFKNISDEKKRFDGFDGFVTNVKNCPLITFHADCLPVYFYDPVTEVIGLVHSGWRGTVLEVCKNTVEKMVDVYGTKTSDIIACIGPGICEVCFSVHKPVYDEFIDKIPYSAKFIQNKIDENNEQKYEINLAAIIEQTLLLSGVKNIERCNFCTCCNSDMFYTHRKQGYKRGSMAALICL